MKPTEQRYPLSWPDRWPRPRTPNHKRERARFAKRTTQVGRYGDPNYRPGSSRMLSMQDATNELLAELKRLGATDCIISTNVEVRLDGLPYGNRKAPSDPGAAVYFTLNRARRVFACDAWDRVEDNLYAIAKHVDALRGQERWGVGTVEQAFTGYNALPAPGQSTGDSWWTVLGVQINATPEQVKEAFRRLAAANHPDVGGDREAWEKINRAYREAIR